MFNRVGVRKKWGWCVFVLILFILISAQSRCEQIWSWSDCLRLARSETQIMQAGHNSATTFGSWFSVFWDIEQNTGSLRQPAGLDTKPHSHTIVPKNNLNKDLLSILILLLKHIFWFNELSPPTYQILELKMSNLIGLKHVVAGFRAKLSALCSKLNNVKNIYQYYTC